MQSRRRNALNGWLLMVGLLSASASLAQSPGIRLHMHGADDGYAADGFLYAPEAATHAPALLLIPDEGGVTPRITATAQQFLDAGYLVVVVDLNRGLSPDAATHTAAEVEHDLAAALDFIASRAQVGHDAVGLIGWGSGGAAALRLGFAARSRAIAIEGAAPLKLYAGLKPASADILASFAGRTVDPTLPAPAALAARLHSLGKTSTVKIYAAAASGFDDPDDTDHFDPTASADLHARQLQFFKQRLAPR